MRKSLREASLADVASKEITLTQEDRVYRFALAGIGEGRHGIELVVGTTPVFRQNESGEFEEVVNCNITRFYVPTACVFEEDENGLVVFNGDQRIATIC
jgi:hypothetical protein